MKVVSNTSPLIHLAHIGRLDLLETLYGELLIPQAEWAEVVVRGKPHVADASHDVEAVRIGRRGRDELLRRRGHCHTQNACGRYAYGVLTNANSKISMDGRYLRGVDKCQQCHSSNSHQAVAMLRTSSDAGQFIPSCEA